MAAKNENYFSIWKKKNRKKSNQVWVQMLLRFSTNIGQHIQNVEKERNGEKTQCLLLRIVMRCRKKPCFIKEMNLFNI